MVLAAPRQDSILASPFAMKFTSSVSALLGCLALASGLAVEARDPNYKSYDGYKVFRLSFGKDVAKVSGIVERLGLTTWKGAPKPDVPSDIVVPPAQVSAFIAEVAGMKFITMHEDLGKSIDKESPVSIYRGTLHCPGRLYLQLLMTLQLERRLISRGSTRTTPTPTISSGSTIWRRSIHCRLRSCLRALR